jgi:hypothetical protein
MEYSKFSLGLRFAMTSDADLSPEKCWNITFSEVPVTYIVGATLFGAWDDVGSAESESAYICMFSNLPLKIGKALFQQLTMKPSLLSYLTIYRPFIQNNLVEKCSEVEYLGSVSDDGSVTGGDVAYGAMKISGALPALCEKQDVCSRILIAPDAWEGKFTSADAARHMLRSAATILPLAKLRTQLIADGGRGTLDALVCSVNGRYVRASIKTGSSAARELQYGILPNRTVVFESESLSAEELDHAFTLPQNKGYTNYIVAAGNGFPPNRMPDGISATILGGQIPDLYTNSAQIEYRNGIETVLDICQFDFHLSRSDWLIVLTRLLDEAGSRNDSTTDALLYHCRALKKHSAVLAFTSDGRFFARIDDAPLIPIETTSFDEAARALFLIIRNTPRTKTVVRRAVEPETVISDT